MERLRPESAWWDLLAGLYVFAAGSAALMSVGWASIPTEYANQPRGLPAEAVVLIVLSLLALITAIAMGRDLWRGNAARARSLFLISAGILACWVIATVAVLG